MNAAEDDPVRRLRVGHAERDAVIETLTTAAAEGRLTTDELTERMESAAAARTYADLDPLVADLPVEPPSTAVTGRGSAGPSRPHASGRPGSGLAPQAGERLPGARMPGAGVPGAQVPGAQLPGRGEGPGWDPSERFVLRAGWENEKRTGRWSVPPYLRVEPVGATVHLDFLEVETDLPVIDIEIVGAAVGAITLIVPGDWGVNVDEVHKSWGSVRSEVSAEPAGRAPLIRVHGSLGLSTLRVRHAGYFERRRLDRGR